MINLYNASFHRVRTEMLDSEGIRPQNTKMEKELVVCIDVGLGELGLAKRSTSHSMAPDFPSRIISYVQDDRRYSYNWSLYERR